MNIDLTAASAFMTTHGRLLDRRRFESLLGGAGAAEVLAALDGYRNADGGYGWGIEPDLRAAESQPAGAMHALEVLAEHAVITPRSVELCDWLDRQTLADGGLPFALPIRDAAGCAPFWADADQTVSSLQVTAQVAANAQLVARHDPAVAAHRWLERATDYCVRAIRAVDTDPHAYELLFALRFLDATIERVPEAHELLEHLGRFIPPDGRVPVAGGSEGEMLRPLDFAPHAGRPVRALFASDVIDTDLERLAALQQPDGGWVVDYASFSPIAALEWRGYATVRAVEILR
ncbi:MAG: hypothetical protein ABI658_03815 [Acidimicrobiales bacterium]